MIMLCNPGNPSGRVLDRDDLITVGLAAAEAGVWVVSDEAYSDIVFDGLSYYSALDHVDVADYIICCGTFSKSYAMTGWRLGFVVAPGPAAEAINLVHRTINGALNSVVQAAGVTALALPDAGLADMTRSYQERRDLVVERLSGIPSIELAVPQGAFYAFPRVRMRISSDELTDQMARAGVIVRSGREYGPSGEGLFRISFATDLDNLEEGLARIRSVLEGVPS
jgi:aspartate aminotransferase